MHERQLVERAHQTGMVIVPDNMTIDDITVSQSGRVVKSKFYPLIVEARNNRTPAVQSELCSRLSHYLRRCAHDLRVEHGHVVTTSTLSALTAIVAAGARGVHLAALQQLHSYDDLIALVRNNLVYVLPKTDLVFSRTVAKPQTGAAPLFVAAVIHAGSVVSTPNNITHCTTQYDSAPSRSSEY